MIFKEQHDRSLWQKCFLIAVLLATVLTSGWLMFADVRAAVAWLAPYEIKGDLTRRVLLISCSAIYFLRLLVTVFVFLRRRMTWMETIIISVLVPLALFSFARVGGANPSPVGVIEMVGILLYVSGSYLNSRSEYSRHVWKAKAENQGRLYTGGLFRYSMHINYFGDMVLFTGLALVTHSGTLLVIPLIMTLNFILAVIPRLDRYLASKYGEEFQEYARRTKRLVPLIY
jgi:protein-S-isoprenylcysteine O-methyltransferase Ste14